MDLNNNKMLIQKAVPKLRVMTYATVLNLEFSFESTTSIPGPFEGGERPWRRPVM